jgi:4-hydroxy-3-polyprenylbenzoate decarboxylase
MSTPPKNLREFLDLLQQHDELVEINVPVSPELEITEITDRVSKSKGMLNKGLLFSTVEGSAMPVAINTLGSYERVKLALGIEHFEEVQQRIQDFVKPQMPSSLLDKVMMLPKLAELNQFLPRTIKGSAPCQEVVITDLNEPILDKIPVITCWPDDGGPFITMPVVFTKNVETGERNAGMYRLQKYSNTSTGMHWHKHHDGNRLYENAKRAGKDRIEVAVALGAPPHVMYSATAPLPPGIDEMIFAGFLHREPVKMVKCKTIDMEVPAESEIILEGYVLLDELKREGPFGDHTGYYSLADDYPIFHITAMTHRKDPIYCTTIVGKPPQEDYYLGKATERIFLPLLKLFIPEVIDMNLPAEGVFHNCIIMSIDKRYPGHARKVMSSVWGFGQMMFSKYVVIVDKDVNVHDLSDVAWRVFNNTDPQRDTMFTEGPLDVLDHACPRWAYGSKMGIDATVKWTTEGFDREWPDEIIMDQNTQDLVNQRWNEYFKGALIKEAAGLVR